MKLEDLHWKWTRWPAGKVARLLINGKPASIVQSEHTRVKGRVGFQFNYTDRYGERRHERCLLGALECKLAQLSKESTGAA